MDGYELYRELDAKTRLLDRAITELRERGKALSEAERDYRMAKAKGILSEREKGTPATLTLDLVMGDKDVSMLRMKRDCADVLYKSAYEFIQTTKLEIRLLDAQIAREMGRAENM